MDRSLTTILERALNDGLLGAALVDRNGKLIAIAGSIDKDEAMPLAAYVMYRLKSADLADRLFAGEVLSLALDDRHVAVGIARRQLFLIAVLVASTPAILECVEQLRGAVASALADSSALQSEPWSGASGSGSGPAALPLVEYGVTVRRRGKA